MNIAWFRVGSGKREYIGHYFQLVVQWMSLNVLAMRWKFSFFKSFVDGWTMGECKGINLLFVSLLSSILKNSIDCFMCAKNARGAHHSTCKV
jgi:hypothetical protein